MAKARGRASVPIAQIGGSAYLLCGQAGPTLRPSRPGVATVRIMTLTLCVSLWPRPDQEAQLVEYEDKVLALLPEHAGRLIARARSANAADRGDGAYETQLIQFDSDASLASYMADGHRTALAAARDAAIERTDIQRVELIPN